MNIFVCTAYLIFAPPEDEERAAETMFLTPKGLKVLILIMFYEYLKKIPFRWNQAQLTHACYQFSEELIRFWREVSARHFQDNIANKAKHKRY